jgi:glycosyltransferase involved in cell wall biosynthesis
MKHEQRAIRIAYVIDKLALHGTQKMLVLLSQHLAQRNYQQRVYCLKDEVHPANKFALDAYGVELRVIGQQQLIAGIGLMRLIAEWRQWQPDIVYTLLFYGNIIGRVLARIANTPRVISSVRAKNVYKNIFHFGLDRITAGLADHVICNSQDAISFAIQYEGVRPEQMTYIPNGVLPVHTRYDVETLRKELGASSDTVLIGSIGRLVPQKGYHSLLQAFRQFQQHLPDSLLLIIGQGPLFSELQAQVEALSLATNVKLLGERTDIERLLSCINVYVQASLFEGMPNALMEAMAAGKPVIATAVDGNRELIENGRTGWLVRPEKPDILAQTMLFAVRHPEESRQLGKTAAQHITAKFSVEKMVDAYDQMFQSVISRTSR